VSVRASPALDPFSVLGVPHTLDLDPRLLEQRYHELSRTCHPDLHRSTATADCIAVLQRSAEVNDAFRVLRDPWERAKALLELRSPGVLDREKRLDPEFLMQALELAESVATAEPAQRPALRAELQQALALDFAAIAKADQKGDFAAAARLFHAASYHRKALRDLELQTQDPTP